MSPGCPGVGSELDWLTALRADAGLPVPEPLRTTGGKLSTAAASPHVPEPRVCSVLRWMDGRVHSAAPRPVHLRRLGSVMARLHNHAAQWPRDVAFGLWFAGTAQVNPAFQTDLSQVLANIGRSLDALLAG